MECPAPRFPCVRVLRRAKRQRRAASQSCDTSEATPETPARHRGASQIALFGDHKPANVVVGIATMSPGYLIEVDAIAVIDHTTESYARTR
jgi:hypothetical protein